MLSAETKAVSWLTTLPQLLRQRKRLILTLIAAYWAYKKLRALMRPRHSVLYGGLEALRPDPALFPQYFLCRGLWLHTRVWTVAGAGAGVGGGAGAVKPRALVFLSHGFAEHAGRYEHVARQLVRECGVNVYALDHQGHGMSEGDRVYVERFEHYADDFIAFVRHVQKQFAAPVPTFLLGHSMGGAIAVQVARRTPCLVRPPPAAAAAAAGAGSPPAAISAADAKEEIVIHSLPAAGKGSPAPAAAAASGGSGVSAAKPPADNSDIWPWHGVILSAPLLVPDRNVATPVMKAVARFASAWLPKLQPRRLDSTAVSRYQSVVENYRKDPLVFNGAMRARWGWEVIRVTTDIQNATAQLRFAFLVLQGSADRLVEPDGAQRFFKTAASPDKTLRMYAGHYHELFNDLDHEKVMADVVAWLKARTADRD